MVIKLRSVFRNRQSLLILKAVLFWGFLALYWSQDGGFISSVIFILSAFYFYASPIFHVSRFFFSFAALTIVTMSAMSSVAITGFLILSVFSAVLFYCLMAIKNLVFVNRAEWHYALMLAVIYVALVAFFAADQSSWFVFRSIGLYFLSALTLWEAMGFSVRASLLTAFLFLESIWIVGFLPLGFLNAANFSILIYFLLTDSLRLYIRGTLTSRALLTRVTIFLLGGLLIFGLTVWHP